MKRFRRIDKDSCDISGENNLSCQDLDGENGEECPMECQNIEYRPMKLRSAFSRIALVRAGYRMFLRDGAVTRLPLDHYY
jgi:hypothetical protein